MRTAVDRMVISRRPGAARWSAAVQFQARDGRRTEFIRDWNKLSMWEQLGWPADGCLTVGQA